MNSIYVIMAFRGTATGETRVIGWYDTYDAARDALVSNSTIIGEVELNYPWYEYALIEEVPMGVYPGADDNKVQFFQWKMEDDVDGKYVECDRPERFRGIVGFTMG